MAILTGAPPSDATLIKLEPASGGGGDRQARVTFSGVVGRTYRIQATGDLGAQPIVWQTIATTTADAFGQMQVIELPPLPPQRFYRAVFP